MPDTKKKVGVVASGIVAAALAIGGVVVAVGPSEEGAAEDVTMSPDVSVAPEPVIVPGEHSICYHRETGVVIAVMPRSHKWGPGEDRPPLKTADVDLPPDFSQEGVNLRQWEYRGHKLIQVPGMTLPEPPEPGEVLP